MTKPSPWIAGSRQQKIDDDIKRDIDVSIMLRARSVLLESPETTPVPTKDLACAWRAMRLFSSALGVEASHIRRDKRGDGYLVMLWLLMKDMVGGIGHSSELLTNDGQNMKHLLAWLDAFDKWLTDHPPPPGTIDVSGVDDED